MKILLVSTQDYIHHPVPSRHHYIFEDLATHHEVHVAHFHVSRDKARKTKLIVDEATQFPFQNPLLHYTFNTPYHFYIFKKIVKDNRFDVIVAAHVLAGSAVIHAARTNDIPVVFDLKDWFPDSAASYFKNRALKKIVEKTVGAITRRNLSLSDRITTVSPSLVEKLRKNGFTSGLITNGVNTDIFKPIDGAQKRKEIGIDVDDFVIGFSGSIERWYSLDEMIQTLPALIRHFPKTKLLIVGGSLFTEYKNNLEKLVSSLGLTEQVIFTGIKPYHELPEYIACMDICAIPLFPPQWGEIALPNKFFEYSACGKPIIMRPIPDVEAIGGPNLFVYRSQEEYMQKVQYLMDHPQKYSLNLERYSWREKSREFENLLKSLV